MHEVDRTRRISALIKQELAMLIMREMNDQRVKMMAITGVTTNRDLKEAIVYVSSYSDEDNSNAVDILNNASGYLRRLLAKNLTIRTTPALTFKLDNTLKDGHEMSELIEKLNAKKPDDLGEE